MEGHGDRGDREVTREQAVALAEEQAKVASAGLARDNAAAVDAALLSAHEEAARWVKRRTAKLEKRLRGEMDDRMSNLEAALTRNGEEAAGEPSRRT